MSITWTEYSTGPYSASKQFRRIGPNDHLLRRYFRLVISVQGDFRVIEPFINVDIVLFTVVDCSGRRGIDESTDSTVFTAFNEVARTGDIDEFVYLSTGAMGWGSGVEDGCCAGLVISFNPFDILSV